MKGSITCFFCGPTLGVCRDVRTFALRFASLISSGYVLCCSNLQGSEIGCLCGAFGFSTADQLCNMFRFSQKLLGLNL